MIRDDLRKLKTGPADLRRFGLTVGGAFTLLALWFRLRHKPFWPCLLIPAAPLFLLGLVCPQSLRRIFIGWMAVALALGTMVATLLLTLLFYLVVTPIGLVARCLGQDFLNRRLDRQAPSYWRPRAVATPRPKDDYERQF